MWSQQVRILALGAMMCTSVIYISLGRSVSSHRAPSNALGRLVTTELSDRARLTDATTPDKRIVRSPVGLDGNNVVQLPSHRCQPAASAERQTEKIAQHPSAIAAIRIGTGQIPIP